MKTLPLTLAALLLAGLPAPAQAESPAEFYKGKTVRLIVSVGVGSGYDVNARALARHLGKHIPGNPQVIVQNQPGAGGLTMTNQMYASGPFDGTAIGATFNGIPTAPLLQPGGVRFDSAKINWVGSTNRETQTMYVWHTAPMKAIDDLKSQEMLVGAQAPGSTQYDYPTLGRALFGLKFKVVTGYKSTSDINLAMERGEVHGTLANWSTVKTLNYQQFLDKKIRILVIWGARRSPELPGIPLIGDMATTPEQKQALQLAQARLEFGRPFLMPPNVPADRVNAIRRAFDATMKDKEYLAETQKLKLEIDPMSGEDIAKMLEQIAKTPADVVARVRTAYEGR
jgi:tripartite-type tricarboxylate transporter receptor subunit TctC